MVQQQQLLAPSVCSGTKTVLGARWKPQPASQHSHCQSHFPFMGRRRMKSCPGHGLLRGCWAQQAHQEHPHETLRQSSEPFASKHSITDEGRRRLFASSSLGDYEGCSSPQGEKFLASIQRAVLKGVKGGLKPGGGGSSGTAAAVVFDRRFLFAHFAVAVTHHCLGT